MAPWPRGPRAISLVYFFHPTHGFLLDHFSQDSDSAPSKMASWANIFFYCASIFYLLLSPRLHLLFSFLYRITSVPFRRLFYVILEFSSLISVVQEGRLPLFFLMFCRFCFMFLFHIILLLPFVSHTSLLPFLFPFYVSLLVLHLGFLCSPLSQH